MYQYLEKICVYLSKMVLFDYELIQNKSNSLLAGGLIFVSFKIIEQVQSNFKAENEVNFIFYINFRFIIFLKY